MSDPFGEDLRAGFASVRRSTARNIVEFIEEYSVLALRGRSILTADEVRAIFAQIIESTRRIGG